MNYRDGSKVISGDIILWDEGTSLGLVTKILEEEEELYNWNQKYPGVFISFNILEKNFDICHVFLERGDFEDEGIEKCSENLLAQILVLARKLSSLRDLGVVKNLGLGIQKWVILEPRSRVWVFKMSLAQQNSVTNNVEISFVVEDEFKRFSEISQFQNIVISSSRLPAGLKWQDI
jgi:hypothetical protein